MEQPRETDLRDLFKSQEPRPHLGVRRFSTRVGSNHQRSSVLGHMDEGRESSAHQQLRAKGYLEWSQGSRETSVPQVCNSPGGRLNGCVLSRQTGNKVMGSLLPSSADLNVGRGKGGYLDSSYKRDRKCDSGQFEQGRSYSSHGVDIEPAGLSMTVEPLGSSEYRSFCHLSNSLVTPMSRPWLPMQCCNLGPTWTVMLFLPLPC